MITNKLRIEHVLAVGACLLAVSAASALTISGNVRMQDGTPIPGVTMRGLPDNPITDNNGFYTATVDAGFSGTVTPTEVNFVFDPTSRTYTSLASDQISQDYTASQSVVSIYGYVRTADGLGVGSVTMSGFPATVVTDATGYYQTYVIRGWTGTVTPTKTGYTFQPSAADYSNVTDNVGPANYSASVSQSGTGGGTTDGGSTDGTSGGSTDGTSDGSTDGTNSGTDGTSNDTNTTAQPACGAGACGAGAFGWLPLSLIGLCGLKLGTTRRHAPRR